MDSWWKKYEGLVPGISDFYPEENWVELISTTQRRLFTYRYPCPNPRAVIILFHGLMVHANWYAHIGKSFAAANILALSMDYEGHGKSEGERSKPDLGLLVEDGCAYIAKVKEAYPDLPLFLLGESTGGYISVAASLRIEGIQGMILMAPALGFSQNFRKLTILSRLQHNL